MSTVTADVAAILDTIEARHTVDTYPSWRAEFSPEDVPLLAGVIRAVLELAEEWRIKAGEKPGDLDQTAWATDSLARDVRFAIATALA